MLDYSEGGKQLQTKANDDVEIYWVGQHIAHGAIIYCGGTHRSEALTWCIVNGELCNGNNRDRDLIPKPAPPVVRYVNIYPDESCGNLYDSVARADANKRHGRSARLKIQYVPGQFDE